GALAVAGLVAVGAGLGVAVDPGPLGRDGLGALGGRRLAVADLGADALDRVGQGGDGLEVGGVDVLVGGQAVEGGLGGLRQGGQLLVAVGGQILRDDQLAGVAAVVVGDQRGRVQVGGGLVATDHD